MKKKSRTPEHFEATVSATEARRSFSMLLDQVESGRQFVVHRRGPALCTIAPAAVKGRRASECLDLLRARSPVLLDQGFGEDLRVTKPAPPRRNRSHPLRSVFSSTRRVLRPSERDGFATGRVLRTVERLFSSGSRALRTLERVFSSGSPVPRASERPCRLGATRSTHR